LEVKKFFMALNFDERYSVFEIMCPKYVISLYKNLYLCFYNFKLCSRNRCSTSVSRLLYSCRLDPYIMMSSKYTRHLIPCMSANMTFIVEKLSTQLQAE